MARDVIDGYARLSEEERSEKAGDVFAAEFRRQLAALPRDEGAKTHARWLELGPDEKMVMLGTLTEKLGLGSVVDAPTLADHSELIVKHVLGFLLDDSLWENRNA